MKKRLNEKQIRRAIQKQLLLEQKFTITPAPNAIINNNPTLKMRQGQGATVLLITSAGARKVLKGMEKPEGTDFGNDLEEPTADLMNRLLGFPGTKDLNAGQGETVFADVMTPGEAPTIQQDKDGANCAGINDIWYTCKATKSYGEMKGANELKKIGQLLQGAYFSTKNPVHNLSAQSFKMVKAKVGGIFYGGSFNSDPNIQTGIYNDRHDMPTIIGLDGIILTPNEYNIAAVNINPSNPAEFTPQPSSSPTVGPASPETQDANNEALQSMITYMSDTARVGGSQAFAKIYTSGAGSSAAMYLLKLFLLRFSTVHNLNLPGKSSASSALTRAYQADPAAFAAGGSPFDIKTAQASLSNAKLSALRLSAAKAKKKAAMPKGYQGSNTNAIDTVAMANYIMSANFIDASTWEALRRDAIDNFKSLIMDQVDQYISDNKAAWGITEKDFKSVKSLGYAQYLRAIFLTFTDEKVTNYIENYLDGVDFFSSSDYVMSLNNMYKAFRTARESSSEMTPGYGRGSGGQEMPSALTVEMDFGSAVDATTIKNAQIYSCAGGVTQENLGIVLSTGSETTGPNSFAAKMFSGGVGYSSIKFILLLQIFPEGDVSGVDQAQKVAGTLAKGVKKKDVRKAPTGWAASLTEINNAETVLKNSGANLIAAIKKLMGLTADPNMNYPVTGTPEQIRAAQDWWEAYTSKPRPGQTGSRVPVVPKSILLEAEKHIKKSLGETEIKSTLFETNKLQDAEGSEDYVYLYLSVINGIAKMMDKVASWINSLGSIAPSSEQMIAIDKSLKDILGTYKILGVPEVAAVSVPSTEVSPPRTMQTAPPATTQPELPNEIPDNVHQLFTSQDDEWKNTPTIVTPDEEEDFLDIAAESLNISTDDLRKLVLELLCRKYKIN